MPTLAEINAKRKELGVSALEAKKALTPTSPLTPTPTGGATIPIAPTVTQTPPPVTPQPEAKA